MANTLKFGNGEWYGKKDTILAYNDENYNYKPLPFSFDRASSATVVNKAGLIETVGSDIPRIDYSDDTKGALLLEPQRTNLYNYSEPTANEGSATDITYESFNWAIGFTNCVKFGDNSATRYRYGGTVSVSTEYTLSAFVIMDDLSEPIIGGQTSDKDFSLVLGGAIVVGVNSSVNMGNNIWRVSGTETTSASASTLNNGIIKYTSQSSKGFRVVGFQIEQGSYATSYIPTQGSAVTRLADVCNNGANEQVINSTEGVLYAEIKNDIIQQQTISLRQGTTDSVQLGLINGGIRCAIVSNNSAVLGTSSFTYSNGQINKYAIVWNGTNAKTFINGQLTNTITTPSPLNLNKLGFDNPNLAENMVGICKDVRVYNTALTDSELQKLTTI
ncbi:LamG domain-containing protein [bacterium]|nr:LamG domain-containing protein [bacterium]